ncbi:MAG TPA: glycosyltransferase 87 family protein [Trebonia sp.]
MDTRGVVRGIGAQATEPGTERAEEAEHAVWPGRRVVTAVFAAFTIYAGAMVFTGHADGTWAVWAFGGYAITTMLLLATRSWVLPLAVALGGALVAPLVWLLTRTAATAEVVVIGRAAGHVLKYGTPYLPPGQLTDWKHYNPYLPLMDIFGLPRAVGISGVLGDTRIWISAATIVLLGAAFAIASPHRLRDCHRCRARVIGVTALAVASPIIAFPLALGVTDPPVIALTCLALAWASRGKVVRAGLVLAVACAMKTTAWAAVPVLGIMAWVQYAPRAAARFGATAIVATGIFSLLAAPEAMATPDDVKAVKQNLIYFPLGLTHHKTPAASPLPGHLIAGLGTAGHYAAVVLMVLAAVAFTAWLLLRPPRDARAVAWRLAVGYAVMFALDPSTRFGYFAYPLALLGWLALTKPDSPERTVAPPQGPLLAPQPT